MSNEPSEDFNEPRSESMIRMKVMGIGGAGSSIVDRLALASLPYVDLVAVNTDQQALSSSSVAETLCIGKAVTGGLGTGGDVEAGREAALADKERLDALLEGVDLLFVVTGLGGGTGTGAAPVVADLAVKRGALVIAFASLPFTIERSARAKMASEGLERLREACNAVIPLPNDLLIQVSDADASLIDALSKADQWIARAVGSIATMMAKTGLINLDFAQLSSIFSHRAGKTLFGVGAGRGPQAAAQALEELKLCPLLHVPEFSKSADHLLVNVIGGPSLGMADTRLIVEDVAETFGAEASIAMGAVIDEELGDAIQLCVIGTSELSGQRMPRTATKPAFAKQKLAARSSEPKKAPEAPPTSPSRSAPLAPMPRGQQDEFSFSEAEPRGEFENAKGTFFEGQDLDTPTYLRRGVKIVL